MAEITFDARVAADYDATSPAMFAPEVVGRTVDLLAEMAEGGPALELAIGTGRIGLPLSQRGVAVHGIDESAAMVEQLRAKPGGAAIPVTIGDMATTRLDGRFRLAYLVFNTITNLLTQGAQVACFQNAAEHLEPGGRFVVECCVCQLRRLPPGETVVVHETAPEHIGYEDFSMFDTETQRADSHHWFRVDGRLEVFTSRHRHVWPSELDLMARLAGLEREHRWADWDRSAFTAASPSAVSVWRKPV